MRGRAAIARMRCHCADARSMRGCGCVLLRECADALPLRGCVAIARMRERAAIARMRDRCADVATSVSLTLVVDVALDPLRENTETPSARLL